MILRDRAHAGNLLAERLSHLRGKDAVVLALPRGGLPVARPISEALGVPLDVVVARKIGAPGQPEFAIGAVTARGQRVLNEEALRYVMLPPGYLERATEEQRRVAEAREHDLRGVRPMVPLAGKIALLVDDGVATGMTMKAAIEDVRAQQPARIVVAAPVIAPETYRDLQERVDEVVVLEVPEVFWAVGQFYEDFRQVEDEEARAMLVERAR